MKNLEYFDFNLFFQKKLLVDYLWIDDYNYLLKDLTIKNGKLKDILYFLIPLNNKYFYYFPNRGKDLFEEKNGEYINWNYIEEIDNNIEKYEKEFFAISFIIDDNWKGFNDYVNKKVLEFTNNNIKEDKDTYEKDFDRPFPEVFSQPSIMRFNKLNYYSLDIQKKKVLKIISNLYKEFRVEFLSIQLNDIDFYGIDIIRILIFLEIEDKIKIIEMDNNKNSYFEDDNIYIKIKLENNFIKNLNILKTLINKDNITTCEYYDFKIFNGNIIKYKDTQINLQYKKLLLFSLFLEKAEIFLDYSFIIEEARLFKDVKKTTISKYINEIKNIIEELTDDYEFINIKGEGYIFRKKQK